MIAPGPRDETRALDSVTAPAPPDVGAAGSARIVRVGGPALPYDRTYHLLGRFDKIRAAVHAAQPDVLEAHSPYLAAAAAIACGRRAARVRTAFWHADHVGAYVRPAAHRWLGARAADRIAAALRRGARALLAPFEAIFVAGQEQARALREAGVDNVVVTPFGVDTATFHPAARDPQRRRALGGDSGHPAILVGVGRLAAEKGWDVVIDAFARLRRRRPAVLVLFGDGPERARLERRAPPGVTFAGFLADRGELAKALASADVLVHGCACETFGLSVAEAVACGLPVVVPDQGGARQSAHPSCSGIYRSGDAAACAAAIERLLERDPCELAERARAAASEVPTAADHVQRVLSVYGELLRTAARRC